MTAAAREASASRAQGTLETGERRAFDLIESMRFDPAEGIAELDRHMERIGASAAGLGFAFDRHDARNALQAATFRLSQARRVRLRLSPRGAVAIEAGPLPPRPTSLAEVSMAPMSVASEDFRLRHSTSDRAFYDEAREAAGTFEVVFVDPQGFVTEGSFTAVFVERDGALLTPPLERGLLPGVLRARLIAEGRAREADLSPGDLAAGLWIGNAVLGLIAAKVGNRSAVRCEPSRDRDPRDREISKAGFPKLYR